MKNYVLNVKGMMCGHCTARVTKALAAVAGVESVDVSLEEGTARVKADGVSAEQLKAAVEAQDYEVTAVAEE